MCPRQVACRSWSRVTRYPMCEQMVMIEWAGWNGSLVSGGASSTVPVIRVIWACWVRSSWANSSTQSGLSSEMACALKRAHRSITGQRGAMCLAGVMNRFASVMNSWSRSSSSMESSMGFTRPGLAGPRRPPGRMVRWSRIWPVAYLAASSSRKSFSSVRMRRFSVSKSVGNGAPFVVGVGRGCLEVEAGVCFSVHDRGG